MDTDIPTQATKIITVTRRCGRHGITLVQHTTLGTMMTMAMNARSVINLITIVVMVTVTNVTVWVPHFLLSVYN